MKYKPTGKIAAGQAFLLQAVVYLEGRYAGFENSMRVGCWYSDNLVFLK
jgi:hypothetical protein